jgi:hypothetical protein
VLSACVAGLAADVGSFEASLLAQLSGQLATQMAMGFQKRMMVLPQPCEM